MLNNVIKTAVGAVAGLGMMAMAGTALAETSWSMATPWGGGKPLEDAKYFVAILLDNLTEASECQRYFLTHF